tara:strand:- start:663 stop:890 length:228 start_codon:yes stop_codon:yes gene_type:complete
MEDYKVGDLVIAQSDGGEKFVAMITSRGFESTYHIMDRPVKLETVIHYRSMSVGGARILSNKQIIKKIREENTDA